MKILVINGSPRGENSLTLQYSRYIEKLSPEVEYEYLHVGSSIGKLERDEELLRQTVAGVASADCIIWLFGVYFEMVPYQLKRFVELIFEHRLEGLFAGKYAASLSTSIRWLDYCAHNYLQAISDDLEMKFAGYYSAHSNDLLVPAEQDRLRGFADSIYDIVERKSPYMKRYKRLEPNSFVYSPAECEPLFSNSNYDILIINDKKSETANLRAMLDSFKKQFNGWVDELDISALDIKGGCISCYRCTYDNVCIYDGKDEHKEAFERVKRADIVIFAGGVRDRYFSARWKLFLDRTFADGHIPVFRDKQLAMFVSGPTGDLSTLRAPFEDVFDWHRGNLVAYISDEHHDSALIDKQIADLATKLVRYADNNYIKSPTFVYAGLSRLVRDELIANMGIIMKADLRHYKKNGMLASEKMSFANKIVGTLFHLKGFRKKLIQSNLLLKNQLSPLQRVVSEAKR